MTKPLFIDVHILHTVPPSNINRDDTGSPKSARFGGVKRARVSSQAWKKATRDLFRTMLDDNELGQRTKYVVEMIAGYVSEFIPGIENEKALGAAAKVLAATGVKVGKDNQTSYLLFAAPSQARALAELAVKEINGEGPLDKKQAKSALNIKENPLLNAVDVAMFGRMVADAPDLNVDASVQVAHAIGVGRMESEFDYFTAVDERSPKDNAGAGMIGTTEFSSATMYRYANIDVLHLCENLGSADAACRSVEAFLKAFAMSMPTGNQNSFANRTLPAAIVLQLRDTQPVSLVNAFEKPVAAKEGKSQVEIACERLAEQEKAIDAAFGMTPRHTYVIMASSDAAMLSGSMPGADARDLDTAIKEISLACAKYLEANGYAARGDE